MTKRQDVARHRDLARLDAEAAVDDDLDTADDAEALGTTTRRRLERVASQVYSVRIPVSRLEDLRQLAAARGEPPTAMLRRWVLERLDAETLGDEVVPEAVRLPHTADDGTAARLENIWPAASRRLLRMLAMRGLERERAEDLVQNVAVRALASGLVFDGVDDFLWWAAPVVRNLHVDFVRAARMAAQPLPAEASVESLQNALDSLTVALELTRPA